MIDWAAGFHGKHLVFVLVIIGVLVFGLAFTLLEADTDIDDEEHERLDALHED